VRNVLIFILIVLCACTSNLHDNKDRYIVLSPEIAELLTYLGVSEKIVGITAECDYPPTLSEKEIIGNFGQINLENVISLKPSIVFTTALEQADITNQLSKLNIKTVQFYPSNIIDLVGVIDSLGVLTNSQPAADSLNKFILTNFVEFEKKAQDLKNKQKAYIEIYGDPIMSVSNDSYVGQLLYYAGMENIFETLEREYSRVSAEDVVKLNPDIIILTYPGMSAKDVANRKGWNVINAVRGRKIYTIDDINPDLILRATPRNVDGVKALQNLLNQENIF